MNSFLVSVLLFAPTSGNSQILSTIGGTGTSGNGGDGGLAISAQIDYPIGGVFDIAGNFYFATGSVGNSVRKISPTGIITTIAGTGVAGYSGDIGPATNAMLKNPQAVAIDANGDLYIADAYNNRIRKVDVSTGLISTVAGDGTGTFGGDGGPATSSKIFGPLDLCFDDSGNLYIADYGNSRVRKINTLGIISTFAGTGFPFNGPGGGKADTTQILAPSGLCSDSQGNIFIANWHSRVYKVDTAGTITTVAGNGISGFGGDNGSATNAQTIPFKIAADKFGNLFIAEYDQERIRVVDNNGYIKTVAGNGTSGYAGDGFMANMAQFNHPAGLALDSCGNLYIADSRNRRVRKISYPKCNYLYAEAFTEETDMLRMPNPIPETVEIQCNYFAACYILDLSGRTLKELRLIPGNNLISTAFLPSGVYVMRVTKDNGQQLVRKIVKQ